MQRSLLAGLVLLAVAGSALAEPQAQVRKVSNQENSYTYYNWKPNKPKPVVTAPAAPVETPAYTGGYTPVRPTPALLNPAAAGGYMEAAPPVAPPAYYGPGPQSYYSNPTFSSGFYNSAYAYPGLQVSNNGFYTGLSINGVYRNGNVTVQAGNPGFYGPGPGFYGPGFNGGYRGGGGFRGGGFQGRPPMNAGFRAGVPR